ncbi:DUF4282 domain-containing protein [Parasphingopyxis marina]|uniref:DUF4282 domain-containing protein n=1 Tax=Parasphingopyxis marina TaxID=2761622 RepID=A0A842HZ85_9SPHN|nr:DUF4282 domain-containing protein [Parasphingopyxis marina]MBC2777671.1 DUF4282 domain-containing protein [Parasphingopyxis marina]
MESYLKFEKFITPTFIQVIFWIGVAGITIFALLSVVGMMSYQPAMAILVLLIGLPLYLIFWRVYCEVMLVLFRILGELQAIKQQGES